MSSTNGITLKLQVSDEVKKILAQDPTFPLKSYVNRHLHGDWGKALPEEKEHNNKASSQDMVVSVFVYEGEEIVVTSYMNKGETEMIMEVRMDDEFAY